MVLGLMFLSGVCRGQDKAADIADLEQQINDEFTKAVPLKQRLDVAEANGHSIVAALDAEQKDEQALELRMQPFEQQKQALDRRYKLLEPALENYNDRVTSHNSHVCTEQCTNGACDGSCGWYRQEKAMLDHNEAELEKAYKPLDEQRDALATSAAPFLKQAQELDDRKKRLQAQYADYKATEDQIKSDWLVIQTRIQDLQRQIAVLKGDTDTCLKAIPAYCDAPDTPDLVTKCENMHAQCGKVFDAN
jgi:chromosome segregation ATPase